MPPSRSPEWGLRQAINGPASRTIVLIPPPEQVGPTPLPPPGPSWGVGAFFSTLLWMCEAKEGGMAARRRKRGDCFSPTPPRLQRQPLSPGPERGGKKGIYLQNKSPLRGRGRGSGLPPGKAGAAPLTVLGQCILITALPWRITKKKGDQESCTPWGGKGVGVGGVRDGSGV